METYPEKRTAAAWAKNCQEILSDINPDYYRNKNAMGSFIEFLRREESGLFISMNFLKTGSGFHYCFALSFTDKKDSPLLFNPMVIGSRFDNNKTIWRQFDEDLGLSRIDPGFPIGIWSDGEWRKNTMENLAHGMTLPEKYLHPHYHGILSQGKSKLISLYECARDMLKEDVGESPDLEIFCDAFNIEKQTILDHSQAASVIDAGKIARGGQYHYGWGPEDNTFAVSDIPLEVIVINHWQAFESEQQEINDIIDIAKRL